jgi:ABC transport permease subunit
MLAQSLLRCRTQEPVVQTINKSTRCTLHSGAARTHVSPFNPRSPISLSPSPLQHHYASSSRPRSTVVPHSSAAGDLNEATETTSSPGFSLIEPAESWHHLVHGAASWLAAYKPPRYVWRTLAALVLGGEVMVRILQGKIHIRNTMDQLNLVGPRSLGVCLLTAAFVGMVFTIQFIREFAKLGLTRSVGGVLALALARELTPVVTSIILAGRVGSAFAAELGTMQVSEQTDSLRVLGSDPVDYLITPRVIACMIAGPILTLMCFCMGMAASVFLADAVYDVPANVILDSACRAIDAWDIITSMIKCWVFGTIISVVSCSWGYTTSGGAKGVGESTTSAVVISLVLIFVFDFALSFLFFQGQGDALKSCM